MSKGLVMSALVLALSNNASASLIEAAHATTALHSSNALSCFNDQPIKSIISAKEVINQETQAWRNKYVEIDESPAPEMFFGPENMKMLNDADLFVRASEEMLRIQVESLFQANSNEISDSTLSAIRQLRVSIAKLRMSITNVLAIEKQLTPAVATTQNSFDMTADALQSLKAATENAYYN